MANEPILAIRACGGTHCFNLFDLEDAAELFDNWPHLTPDRLADVEKAYNIPLEIPSQLEEDDLQRILDFLLEDEETQDLIKAYLSTQCEDLFSRHYSDVWEIKRAAENAHAGTTDNLTEWLFNRFLENRPEAGELADFLDKEKCAEEMADYYTEQDGFIFYKD